MYNIHKLQAATRHKTQTQELEFGIATTLGNASRVQWRSLVLSKSHISHLHSQDVTVKFWPLLDKDTCNGNKTHQHSAALRQNASAFRLCIYSKSNAYKKYLTFKSQYLHLQATWWIHNPLRSNLTSQRWNYETIYYIITDIHIFIEADPPKKRDRGYLPHCKVVFKKTPVMSRLYGLTTSWIPY